MQHYGHQKNITQELKISSHPDMVNQSPCVAIWTFFVELPHPKNICGFTHLTFAKRPGATYSLCLENPHLNNDQANDNTLDIIFQAHAFCSFSSKALNPSRIHVSNDRLTNDYLPKRSSGPQSFQPLLHLEDSTAGLLFTTHLTTAVFDRQGNSLFCQSILEESTHKSVGEHCYRSMAVTGR